MKQRILQLRKQYGFSQEQLGEKLGVSRQAISKWESGTATPDVDNIIAMCDLFDVTADYLLRGKQLETAGGQPSSRSKLFLVGCILLIAAAMLLPVLLFGPYLVQWMEASIHASYYTDAWVYLDTMPLAAVKYLEYFLLVSGAGCLIVYYLHRNKTTE